MTKKYKQNKTIIVLTGAAGSGKSAAAVSLQHKGYTLIKFAAPIKRMLHTGLGITMEDLEGVGKNEPNQFLCGKTPREGMQLLGTEFRDMISRDLWLLPFDMAVDTKAHDDLIVVDDARFDHEIEHLRKTYKNVIVVNIQRPDVIKLPDHLSSHVSENGISSTPDHVISNDGSRKELQEKVKNIIELISVDGIPYKQ